MGEGGFRVMVMLWGMLGAPGAFLVFVGVVLVVVWFLFEGPSTLRRIFAPSPLKELDRWVKQQHAREELEQWEKQQREGRGSPSPPVES